MLAVKWESTGHSVSPLSSRLSVFDVFSKLLCFWRQHTVCFNSQGSGITAGLDSQSSFHTHAAGVIDVNTGRKAFISCIIYKQP